MDLEANVSEKESTYEIFRLSRTGPIWVEAVSDLVKASERMEQLAVKNPDFYFVIDPKSQEIVARIGPKSRFQSEVLGSRRR